MNNILDDNSLGVLTNHPPQLIQTRLPRRIMLTTTTTTTTALLLFQLPQTHLRPLNELRHRPQLRERRVLADDVVVWAGHNVGQGQVVGHDGPGRDEHVVGRDGDAPFGVGMEVCDALAQPKGPAELAVREDDIGVDWAFARTGVVCWVRRASELYKFGEGRCACAGAWF